MRDLVVDLSKYDLAKVRFDKEAIASILPHRHEMALVDGVYFVDLEDKTSAGFIEVGEGLFWERGHFPGNPVFPGVLLLEASAQLSLVMYKTLLPEFAEKLTVFGSADRVRFRGMVRPGDRVVLTARTTKLTARFSRSDCQAFVGDKLIFEAEVVGVNV